MYLRDAGGASVFLLLLSSTNEMATSSFLSRDIARFALVILAILTGVIVCALIVYGERASEKLDSPVLKSEQEEMTTKPEEIATEQEPRHTHRNVVVSVILVIIIGIMILGGGTLAILDYYNVKETGSHLHIDISGVTSSGNTFLDLSTLMLVALIVGIFLIVGIMVLAISLRPKPEELVGWTRPEPLRDSETGSGYTESIINFTQSPQPLRPSTTKRVICRYCGHEIANGRYCSECHLTSGYVVSDR